MATSPYLFHKTVDGIPNLRYTEIVENNTELKMTRTYSHAPADAWEEAYIPTSTVLARYIGRHIAYLIVIGLAGYFGLAALNARALKIQIVKENPQLENADLRYWFLNSVIDPNECYANLVNKANGDTYCKGWKDDVIRKK